MYLPKIIGFALVFLGCSGLGVFYSMQMKQKILHIKEMIRILEMFCSEIDYGQSTLPECCEVIGEKVSLPYGEILQRISAYPKEEGIAFGEISDRYLRDGLKELPVGEEKEAFIKCFLDIGYADGWMQKRCMERGIEQLQGYLDTEEAEIKTKSKLAVTLGIMCGLLLVLIML